MTVSMSCAFSWALSLLFVLFYSSALGGEEAGRIKEGYTVIVVCSMRIKPIFNKRKMCDHGKNKHLR